MNVTVIGAGLAGSECAWQLARRGHRVRLFEMRPGVRTVAHQTDRCAELVCSNSFRSDNPMNAVGLLKREMEALDSEDLMPCVGSALPAGDALAMDRAVCSGLVTEALAARPEIEIVRDEVRAIPPDGMVVIATGPLTSEALDHEIGNLLGTEDLYFYDSIAPVVVSSSLDFSKMYAMSRYGKGDGDDYWNCPLDRGEYEAFVSDLLAGETVPVHDFEKGIYFEGCLPIEVMAERGRETLRHGPLKPMGLNDPRTGRMPWAVVQLRQDDLAREHYNLVGFQTKLKIPEQQRIFRKIPGLAGAVFARYGMLHATPTSGRQRTWTVSGGCGGAASSFAGQITVWRLRRERGDGLAVGLTSPRSWKAGAGARSYTTAIGSLAHLLGTAAREALRADERDVRVDRGHVALAGQDKAARRKAMVERALSAIGEWKWRSRRGRGWRGERDDASAALTPTTSHRERGHHVDVGGHQGGAAEARGVAIRTPVLHSRQFDEEAGATVFFKAENLQRAGVQVSRRLQQDQGEWDRSLCRGRGLFLRQPRPGRGAGVEAAGLKATIVMPKDAPRQPPRRAGTAPRSSSTTATPRAATRSARSSSASEARSRSPFDDELIMAGAGTATAELLEEVPGLDVLLVPVSGAGLIAGSATAAKHLRPDITSSGSSRKRPTTRRSLSRRRAGLDPDPRRSPTACRSEAPES